MGLRRKQVGVYRKFKFKRYFATAPLGLHPLGCRGHRAPPSLARVPAAGRRAGRQAGSRTADTVPPGRTTSPDLHRDDLEQATHDAIEVARETVRAVQAEIDEYLMMLPDDRGEKFMPR